MQDLVTDLVIVLRDQFLDSIDWKRLRTTCHKFHRVEGSDTAGIPGWIIYRVPSWEPALRRLRCWYGMCRQMAMFGWPSWAPVWVGWRKCSRFTFLNPKVQVVMKWYRGKAVRVLTWDGRGFVSLRGCTLEFFRDQRKPGKWHKCDLGGSNISPECSCIHGSTTDWCPNPPQFDQLLGLRLGIEGFTRR